LGVPETVGGAVPTGGSATTGPPAFAEVALALPTTLVAVTVMRIRLPTSAAPSA
jgi:hypothetical protein